MDFAKIEHVQNCDLLGNYVNNFNKLQTNITKV
jgi:hypothetical protein